jgi:hypothetical protein
MDREIRKLKQKKRRADNIHEQEAPKINSIRNPALLHLAIRRPKPPPIIRLLHERRSGPESSRDQKYYG